MKTFCPGKPHKYGPDEISCDGHRHNEFDGDAFCEYQAKTQVAYESYSPELLNNRLNIISDVNQVELTSSKYRIIAVDFDGVIHDHENPIEGRRMGAPIDGAQEALEYLKGQGDKIIIFCVWAGSDQGKKTISDWMVFYEIPFNDITNIKPNADFYIDDRAIRFVNWENTLEEFL